MHRHLRAADVLNRDRLARVGRVDVGLSARNKKDEKRSD
jgi:hypothetical protein